jgi:hypothetical protein
MTNSTTTMQQVATVVARAKSDPAFRSSLLNSTAATLQSAGITVPAGVSVSAVQNSASSGNLVVPAMPSGLSADAQQEITSLAASGAAAASAFDGYAKLVIDAWRDGNLMAKLLSNPSAVLSGRGITVPSGLTLNAFQATDSESYMALPDSSTTAQSEAQITAYVTANMSSLTSLITAGSYAAGLAFSLSGVMQFKTHKDNPTQIPVGTPIALLFIGAALIFIPTF